MSVDVIRRSALPLAEPEDLDPLLRRIGDARVVLIGEASHGTRDFYLWRAALTRRLISEKGFGFVAVEGDRPDCERVGRALLDGADPYTALYAISRWPTFMWANEEVVAFCRWLARWNRDLPPGRRCGFYGMDVYGLWDSLHAVRRYTMLHLPDQADTLMRALRCFEDYGHDPQMYGMCARLTPESCEDEVVRLLAALWESAPRGVTGLSARRDGEAVAGAEGYYRTMVRGGPRSWNVRETHMADTLDRLMDVHGPGAKAVVWAHNTHVGDARGTGMARAGMTNLGRLARERYGADAVLVGFGTHRGTVVAGRSWDAPSEVMPVPPAHQGSLESLLHAAELDQALFIVPPPGDRPAWYDRQLTNRAIGVVYDPDGERWGNYVPSVLGRRYDAYLWLSHTRALHPLHREPPEEAAPEIHPATV